MESWHALGQAIREAQEMGLHREQPRKYVNGGESYTTIWQREIEKRVWVNLYVWDRYELLFEISLICFAHWS